MERVREKRRVEERRAEREDDRRERDRRKKMQVHEKVGKSRNIMFSNDLWLRRVESRLAKAAGAEPAGQMRDEKVHAVVARSTFPSQNIQSTPGSDHFGSCDVEKVHVVVARSTFRSQNVQNIPFSDHFWKLRCRKSARRCGANKISKSKCAKRHMFAPLLEVQMSFRVAGARDCAPCRK